jgi:glycosyltransferase involved in cell wall biosynthesis
MDYDVVIATRNRAEVLKISIPLIFNQSRPLRKLIIVDSSDNHKAVKQNVTEIVGNAPIKLEILHTKPNSSQQRNLGVERVESPVVMFPDDDSLWWPGMGEAIMRIYERDTNGDIGGVCGRETNRPPPDIDIVADDMYRMRISDRIRQKIGGFRHKFDDKFCPDPLWIHGRSCWNVRPFPQWLYNIDAALVEFMGGFRMSFKTELIRKYKFDEDLGTYIGYAAYEDADASFKILQEKLLVGAHDAHVYHYKAPNQRANGFELGFILLFNRAYIICRYSPLGSCARTMLKRFALYKISQYLLNIGSKFGRDRVRGVWVAINKMEDLLNTPPELLRQRYLELCQEVLHRNPAKIEK